jgi:hypothetical protein
MNRFIEKLRSYPSDLTLEQLIIKVDLDESLATKREENTIERVKEEFKDTYFKSGDTSIFGKGIEVLHIVEIMSSERTTDWDLIYNIKGTRLTFSPSYLSKEELKGDGVRFLKTEDDLRKRMEITKAEYQVYLNKYESITEQLKNI